MRLGDVKLQKVLYTKLNPDTGKEVKKMARVGVKVEVDGVIFSYNFRRQTFSVTYPNRELSYKSGTLNGEIEKGQKFSGLTYKQFAKDFSPKLVELVGTAILEQISE